MCLSVPSVRPSHHHHGGGGGGRDVDRRRRIYTMRPPRGAPPPGEAARTRARRWARATGHNCAPTRPPALPRARSARHHPIQPNSTMAQSVTVGRDEEAGPGRAQQQQTNEEASSRDERRRRRHTRHTAAVLGWGRPEVRRGATRVLARAGIRFARIARIARRRAGGTWAVPQLTILPYNPSVGNNRRRMSGAWTGGRRTDTGRD